MYDSKRLWRTFIFLMLTSFVMAGGFSYLKWEDIKNDTRLELVNVISIISKSKLALLNKNEAIMKLVAQQYIQQYYFHETKSSFTKLNNNITQNITSIIINQNKEILALGVAKSDGILHYSYQNKLYTLNLTENSALSKTYMGIFAEPKFTMGRTIKLFPVNQWVIPLFLPVVTAEGKTIATLVMLLKLDATAAIWSKNIIQPPMKLVVIRSDYYRQYSDNVTPELYDNWFNYPFPEKQINIFKDTLKEQTQFTLEQLKTSQKIISMVVRSSIGNERFQVMNYEPDFKHFTIIGLPMTVLQHKFYTSILKTVVVLLTFNLLLFFIFKRHIQLIQQSKNILTNMALHDPLTLLPNRRYLLDYFEDLKNKLHKRFFVIFIDLNNFKSYNDLHGHSAGDQILIEVAHRINSKFYPHLCIRHGGDEFIVLHPLIEERELLSECEEFLSLLQQPLTVNHIEFSINASLGISISPQDGKDIDSLLRKADMAMYEAKKNHSHIYIYSQWLEKRNSISHSIEQELHHAIQNKEFYLVYQPQIDSKSGKIVAVEALLRWKNRNLGDISPIQFIPVAEKCGLIIEIGQWVLSNAVLEISSILNQLDVDIQHNNLCYNQPLRLSINASVVEVQRTSYPILVLESLKGLDLEKIELTIEVTENIFMENVSRSVKNLKRLINAGIRISLDDFGTGFSALNLLNKLPLHEIKIDQSFCRNLLNDESGYNMIKNIIQIGHNLDIPVIAEGVETESQFYKLTELQCDTFQGYYFSEPLTLDELRHYLMRELG